MTDLIKKVVFAVLCVATIYNPNIVFAGNNTNSENKKDGEIKLAVKNHTDLNVRNYEALADKVILPSSSTVKNPEINKLDVITDLNREKFIFESDRVIYVANGVENVFRAGVPETYFNRNKECSTKSMLTIPVKADKHSSFSNIRSISIHLDADQHINMIEFDGKEYYLNQF